MLQIRQAQSKSMLLIICLLMFSLPVLAEPERGDTVASRIHPEFQPQGLNLNGLYILPAFIYTGMYNDNVFANDSFKKSSFVSEFSPRLALLSDWNKHAANLSLSADLGRNDTFSSEDYDDWAITVDGKIDIKRSENIYGGVSMIRDHIERTSPNDAGGLTPTEFDKNSLFAKYRRRTGQFLFDVGANIEKRNYYNVAGIRSGTIIVIDNNQRDRTITTLQAGTSYEYLRNLNTFMRFKIEQRDYDNLQTSTNNDRSSDDYEASIGFDLDLDGILVGNIAIGYASRNYIQPFPDISEPVINASVNWNISRLTTLRLDTDRTIRETFIDSFSGYLSTTAEFGIDHELRRNLLLNGSFIYRRDEYAGIGNSTRDDKTYDIVVGSTYTLSRNLSASIQYHYLERKSVRINTGNRSSDFINNVIFIQLQTQY